MRRALALLVTLTALALPAVAAAQSCPQTSIADIEDEVMCPVCGTPLAVATEAPQAQDEREYIQELIDDCKSKDEIKRALVAQFGDGVLALPGDGDEDDAGDVLVYLIPAIALVLGAVGIAFAVTRWRRRGGAPGPLGSDAAPATGSSARLDDDLERYDL